MQVAKDRQDASKKDQRDCWLSQEGEGCQGKEGPQRSKEAFWRLHILLQ